MDRTWYETTCNTYQTLAEKHDTAILYHVDDAGHLRVVSYEYARDETTTNQTPR
jgi:hypothetical protein